MLVWDATSVAVLGSGQRILWRIFRHRILDFTELNFYPHTKWRELVDYQLANKSIGRVDRRKIRQYGSQNITRNIQASHYGS